MGGSDAMMALVNDVYAELQELENALTEREVSNRRHGGCRTDRGTGTGRGDEETNE
jgi:hypothetical protein